MASQYSNTATNTDFLTSDFDSSASVRRPSVPSGIVLSRLDHFRTLAADLPASSCRRGDDNEDARQGWGRRAETTFGIPASRNTILDASRKRPYTLQPGSTQYSSPEKPTLDRSRSQRWENKRQAQLKAPRMAKSCDALALNADNSIHDHARTEKAPAYRSITKWTPKERRFAEKDLFTQPTTNVFYADGTGDREGRNVCHSCGKILSPQEPCFSCGHAFCAQCTTDMEESASLLEQDVSSLSEPSSVCSPGHDHPGHDDNSAFVESAQRQRAADPIYVRTSPSRAQRSARTSGRYHDSRDDVADPPLPNKTYKAPSSTSQIEATSSTESSTVSRLQYPENTPRRCLPRHCICCAARQPIARRRTIGALQSFPFDSVASIDRDLNSVSSSGSSTVTPPRSSRSTTRQPELRGRIEDANLLPPALQPRRRSSQVSQNKQGSKHSSTEAASSRSLPDPYEGYRSMKPHPHEPEPDTLAWPRLRHITEPSTSRAGLAAEHVPWARATLKRVSKLPEDRPKVRELSQTPISQWRKQLKKVDEDAPTTVEGLVPQSCPARLSKIPSRVMPEPVFCDGNRSESIRLGKRPASVEPKADDGEAAELHLNTRPSRVSVRQVERALAGSHQRDPAEETKRSNDRSSPLKEPKRTSNRSSNPSRDVKPGIMKSPSASKRRDHACLWRDRFMDLSAEVDQLRCELDSCEDVSHTEVNGERERGYNETSKQSMASTHECDDTGIEGLTVVVHLKGKDDLVINTDLRTEP